MLIAPMEYSPNGNALWPQLNITPMVYSRNRKGMDL